MSASLPATLFAQDGLHIEAVADTRYFANFVNAHHSYIKWRDRPSRTLRWMLFENGNGVGAFEIGSAWTFPKDIKQFMSDREIGFNQLANNTVFCLHQAETKNAASRFLKMLRRDAKRRWLERYNDDLRALQTFILPPRTGACYKADNWKCIGETSGYGMLSETVSHNPDGSANIKRRETAVEQKLIFVREL